MAANDYVFISHWRVQSTKQEVCDVLDDAAALARWWPSVYLDVKVLDQGGEKGVGKIVELFTKGWLPYSLRWKFKVTASNAPDGYTIEAFGDFGQLAAKIIKTTTRWSARHDQRAHIGVFEFGRFGP